LVVFKTDTAMPSEPRARSRLGPTPRKGAGRPPGAVSEETRARIIDAGCKCFSASGYSRTSNEDIARLVGLTTGALYHYFGSKAELFAAVHRHVHSILVGVYRRAFEEETTCLAQLSAGLEGALAVTKEQPAMAHFAAVASLEIERHPELDKLLRVDTEEMRSFYRRVFIKAQQRGEIASDIDIEAVLNLVQSSLLGLVQLRSQVRRPEQYEAAIRAFERLLQGTLFTSRER
jgi:AcrR family transcriptional regulator